MFGLKEIHIEKIKKVFLDYQSVDKVILYGSRAKGNYRQGSDIDLSLVGENISLNTLLRIENDLDDLLLPYQMDVSVFSKIENPDLIAHINRVGVVIYHRAK